MGVYKHLFRIVCALFLTWNLPVVAGDGVLEINQACAVNSGCFNGDSAGFPVSIGQPGSYRLTSSLSITDPAVLAVSITADDVSLDLNGFAVNVCVDVVCEGDESESAINANLAGDVRIHNGVVQGAKSTCVKTGARAELENLRIKNCGDGIAAGENSRIFDVSVSNSTSIGIYLAGKGTLVAGSTVNGSGQWGIAVTANALIVDTVIRNNPVAIQTISASSPTRGGYHGCVITENGGEEVQPIGVVLVDMGGNICGTDTVCP